MANEGDPVKELPQNVFRYMHDLVAPFFQPLFWRHVGMTLFLHTNGGYSFHYPRLTNNYCRVLWDDWTVEEINCRACCVNCCKICSGSEPAGNLSGYHGYPEYMHRLESNRQGIQKQNVGQMYQQANETEADCLFCPFLCPPPTPEDGEMKVHYY